LKISSSVGIYLNFVDFLILKNIFGIVLFDGKA